MQFRTFKERWEYLRLNGSVGEATFGSERFLNQDFYHSAQWRKVRREIIIRDSGCDLGFCDLEIHDGLYIHHMNPMTVGDLIDGNPDILDPRFLITVSHRTHNSIHYGDENLLPQPFVERRPGDTKLW